MKKIFYITILISYSMRFIGQTFKNDWTTFTNKNWTITFNSDQKPSFDKNSLGQVFFKNKKDNTITVTYDVFSKADIDSIYIKKVLDSYTALSCRSVAIGEYQFNSFYYNNFYYSLKPCPNCHTERNKACRGLGEQLEKFILTK